MTNKMEWENASTAMRRLYKICRSKLPGRSCGTLGSVDSVMQRRSQVGTKPNIKQSPLLCEWVCRCTLPELQTPLVSCPGILRSCPFLPSPRRTTSTIVCGCLKRPVLEKKRAEPLNIVRTRLIFGQIFHNPWTYWMTFDDSTKWGINY